MAKWMPSEYEKVEPNQPWMPSAYERVGPVAGPALVVDPDEEDREINAILDMADIKGLAIEDAQEAVAVEKALPTRGYGGSYADNPIGFWEGLLDNPEKFIPIWGTTRDIGNLAGVMSAAKRLEQNEYGQPVAERPVAPPFGGMYAAPGYKPPADRTQFSREADQQEVNAWIEKQTEIAERGYSFGGRVGQIMGEMPAFMADILLTRGLYTGTKAGVNAVLKTAAKQTAGKYAKRAVAVGGAKKLTAWAIASGVRAGLGTPHRVLETYLENRLPENVSTDDNGDLVFQWPDEEPHTTLLKAWGDVAIEMASEEAGEVLSKAPGAIAGKLTSTRFGGKILPRLYEGYRKLHPKTKWSDFVKKATSATGFHGIVGELGEEYLGDQMRAVAGVDDFGAGPDAGVIERIEAAFVHDVRNTPEMFVSFLPLSGGAALASRIGGKGQQAEVEPGRPTPYEGEAGAETATMAVQQAATMSDIAAQATEGLPIATEAAGQGVPDATQAQAAPEAVPGVRGEGEAAGVEGVEAVTKTYSPAADIVDGLVVRQGPIPNTDSIAAELGDDYAEVGVVEIPFADFTGTFGVSTRYSVEGKNAVRGLQQAIEESGEITPLIVVQDKDGLYVLEGATRADALFDMGKKSFPALLVQDTSETSGVSSTPTVAPSAPAAAEAGEGGTPLNPGISGQTVYHGTSMPFQQIKTPGENLFTESNIYGQGFYTTDSPDVAKGYTKKGKGAEPTVYNVNVPEEVEAKLYDLESPIEEDLRQELIELFDDYGAPWEMDENEQPVIKTLAGVYDDFRDWSVDMRVSSAEVQDYFDSIRGLLEKRGYRGVKHDGGKFAGKRKHQVRIFWYPQQDLGLAIQPKTPAAEAGDGRQAWEMTREEYADQMRSEGWRPRDIKDNESQRRMHMQQVEQAVEQNQPVPRAVLEEYKTEPWAQEALSKLEAETPAVQQPQAATEAQTGKQWGDQNTGVTRAEYEAIKARQAKEGKLKGGRQAGGTMMFDPKAWADAVKVARFHLEAGARKFADWAAKMVADYGEDIKPHLDRLWKDAHKADETVVEALRKSLAQARKVAPVIAAEKSAELSKRVGKAAPTVESLIKKDVPAREAVVRSKGALAGQLTQYEQRYRAIRDELGEETVEALHRRIALDNDLQYFQKDKLGEVLDKLIDGHALTLHQARLLSNYFGKGVGDVARTHVPLGDRFWLILMEALNIPRTSLASMDLSGILRQGRMLMSAHPEMATDFVTKYGKAFASEKFAKELEAQIKGDPLYEEAKQAGLELPEWGTVDANINELSEEFMAARLLQWIPGIRASERSFVNALNWFRMAVYSKLLTATEIARGREMDLQEKKHLARVINNLSGRSSLPNGLKGIAPILNAVFFSPRFALSRFALAKDIPMGTVRSAGTIVLDENGKAKVVLRPELQPELKLALKATAGLIGTNLLIMGLIAFVAGDDDDLVMEMDPRATDFGKIRYKNFRVDLWAGYIQAARFMARMATGQIKQDDGEIREVDRWDVFKSFIETKESPIASTLADAWRGETMMGRPFLTAEKGGWLEKTELPDALTGTLQETWERMVPLVIQDTTDALIEEGIPEAVTAGTLAVLGAGIQTYAPSGFAVAKQQKNEIAEKAYGEKWDNLKPSQQKTLRRKHAEIDEAERSARRERYPMTSVDISEQAKVAKRIHDSLNQNVQRALDEYAIGTGITRRILGDFWLNEKRYQEYERLAASEINTTVRPRIQSHAWPKMKAATQEDILKKTVNTARERARNILVQKMERGEL